jgi:hypothetical protein
MSFASRTHGRVLWISIGLVASGCFDPLTEDPGFSGADDPGAAPLPVGPDELPGPAVSSAAGSSAPSPTSPIAGSSSTTMADAVGPTSTAAAGSTAAGSSTQGATSSSGHGATGAVASEQDAGLDFPDAQADAGPDGSTSVEGESVSSVAPFTGVGSVTSGDGS